MDVRIEINQIIREEIAACDNELAKLPSLREMLEKKIGLTQYYSFTAQKCVLEKVRRRINKAIKKETVSDQTIPVS